VSASPVNWRRRHWLTAGIAVPAAAALPTRADGAQRRPWPKARPTPAVELPLFDGTAWTLASQRGRVTALNFWASWCEPCRAEMPSLELLAQRHEADGLVVMAINHKESAAAIRRFNERESIALPILRDVDGAVARAFGVGIFPTTMLIGRDGRAAFSVVGEADWQAAPARQWIAGLL
jgi:thiol-disulfide isomerase/thioredoxin